MDEIENVFESDPYTLLSGMFASQLPPLIPEIINEKASKKIVDEVLATKNLFRFDEETGLIMGLDNSVKPPKYIYGNNWATESIKYFTIKLNDAWRPLAIPNIKLSLMFAYNSLIASHKVMTDMYTKDERLSGKTSHSESPIIGSDGKVINIFYEDGLVDYDEEPIGFIGYNNTNAFFKDSKMQRFGIESTYPYILQIDITNFFENIYSHTLAKINPEDFQITENFEIFQKYLAWLDEYNQKINDNHTKGIIQGPISSKISAELLQLAIDQEIVQLIYKFNLNINFTRYVDDYRFFATNISDLEFINHHLTKLFRRYELSINSNKSKIYKGFELEKQANLRDYPKIDFLTQNEVSKISFEDYNIFRNVMIKIINNNDIPTAKSVLTVMKIRISAGKIKLENFEHSQFVISLIRLLIKIVYVKPILASHSYGLISQIVLKVDSDTKKSIWKILFDELSYIEDNFRDTDIEVWHFYALANAGGAKETSKVFSSYKKLNKGSMSPIVLTVLLKERSKLANKKIESEIIEQGIKGVTKSERDDEWNRISQSKWWLPLSKLWVVTDRNVDKDVKNLFISSNRAGKIKWNELGIIEFMLQNID